MLNEDKESLKVILSRLDLYVDDLKVFKIMGEEAVLDLKIHTWAVKEIYLSPHRVLLNGLTREKFMLKYKKARKYISEDKGLKELINYFIVCLHEQLEEGGSGIC